MWQDASSESIAEPDVENMLDDTPRQFEVAHIDLSRELRGGARQMILLAEALRDLPAGNDLKQRLIVRGETPVAAACKKIGGVAAIAAGRTALSAAKAAIGADIVHVHDEAGVAAGALLTHRGLPFVATRRVVSVPSVSFVTRWAWGRASRVVGVSDRVSSVMRAYLNADNVTTIVDSVALPTRSDAEQSPRDERTTFVVGCLGPVDFSIKGQDLLLDAARRLLGTCPEVDVIFTGDGPDHHRLIDLAAQLPNVRVIGWQDDIATFMQQLDALVLPSRFEALGAAMLEAMAMAVPVVAADCGGVSELLQHEVNGLLVVRDSPNELARAIARLAHDESLTRRLGASSLRTAARHGTRRMAEDYFSAYLNILAWEQARRLSL